MKLIDGQAIEFPCPHCSGENSQTIGQLKRNPKLTCRRCRQDFTVDAHQLRTAVQQAEKSLADLQRQLGRLGK